MYMTKKFSFKILLKSWSDKPEKGWFKIKIVFQQSWNIVNIQTDESMNTARGEGNFDGRRGGEGGGSKNTNWPTKNKKIKYIF